jgi:gliding motility-associated-like protein
MTTLFRKLFQTNSWLWNRLSAASWLGCLLFFVSPQNVRGQQCTGVAGEPPINQSFGTKGGRNPLVNETTYRFSTSTCPDNGEYGLMTSTAGNCFDNAWHNIPEDHTPGDVQGNMLVINAADEKGAFYQQTLTGLCAGTRYEFSLWGVNLLKPGICSDFALPNLTIQIETSRGQVVQTIDFGFIDVTATPVWRRFSTTFTAPKVAEPVVVRLINNQGAGGCGNDLALDDIQLKQCDVCPPEPAYVPDVFTPNGDGVNDQLSVFLENAVSFTLSVFNRWGKPVFSSDALTQRWDGNMAGSPCETGHYTWIIRYKVPSSENAVREYVQEGRVLLLR